MRDAPVLTRALVFGALATIVLGVVGATVGWMVAGVSGLLSAALGAGATAAFMVVTTVSVVVADRATRGSALGPKYLVVILSALMIKFLLFAAILVVAREQSWMNPYVFFVAMVIAVIVSLVADFVAVSRARVSYEPGVSVPRGGDSIGTEKNSAQKDSADKNSAQTHSTGAE